MSILNDCQFTGCCFKNKTQTDLFCESFAHSSSASQKHFGDHALKHVLISAEERACFLFIKFVGSFLNQLESYQSLIPVIARSMMRLLRKSKIVDPYDLWAQDESQKKLKKKTKSHVHPSVKRTKKNPLPHPGQSYNPDPKDHEKLLEKVARKELEYVKKQKSLDRAVNVKVNKAEIEEDEKNEVESGIKHLIDPTTNHDSDNSDTDVAFSDYDEKDFEAILKDKKVVNKRKTKQQRMKRLKDSLIRKAAKIRKFKNVQLSKLDGIKKVIKEIDNQTELHRKRSLKQKKERLSQRRSESDPIYCLKSELPSNLRKVSCPMNDIVKEQFECFQSRLMLEPTQFQNKKQKYKKKAFERKLAAEQTA